MKDSFIVKPIGYIRSDFKEKFGIPRQSGRAPSLTAEILLLPEYARAETFKGVEGFSHLWILFDFSRAHREEFSPTVRPPRLGGNERVGVFASRSPFRPNPIGLSCVRLEKIDLPRIFISGGDFLDGTPVLDIKPYLPFADCIPAATAGYAEQGEGHRLTVECPDELLRLLPKDKRAGLLECLADDPRPSYQADPEKIYGMKFGEYEVKFTVDGELLRVIFVDK